MITRYAIAGLALAVGCAQKTPVMYAQVQSVDFSVEGPTGDWAPSQLRPTLLALGQWIQVGQEVGYVYVDSEAGLSARVDAVRDGGTPSVLVRRLVWAPGAYQALSANEARERGLALPPDWLVNYEPQPPNGALYGAWRSDPALQHRFHPDYPDDLRVVMMGQVDDGPYYEIVWVGLRACDDRLCRGALLNQPTHLPYMAGQQVLVDFDGVAPDRLPLARGVDEPVNEQFVQLAATHPGLQGQLQDAAAWVSTSIGTEESLVPVGSWARVGGSLVYFLVLHGQPVAWVVDGEHIMPTPWRPDSTVLLDDAERQELGLPAVLSLPDSGPQPEPGLWGRWRIDERTAWLFDNAGSPDRVFVLDALDGEPIQVDVFECEAITCTGVVVQPGHAWQGKQVQFTTVRVPDLAGRQLPVAQRR